MKVCTRVVDTTQIHAGIPGLRAHSACRPARRPQTRSSLALPHRYYGLPRFYDFLQVALVLQVLITFSFDSGHDGWPRGVCDEGLDHSFLNGPVAIVFLHMRLNVRTNAVL